MISAFQKQLWQNVFYSLYFQYQNLLVEEKRLSILFWEDIKRSFAWTMASFYLRYFMSDEPEDIYW